LVTEEGEREVWLAVDEVTEGREVVAAKENEVNVGGGGVRVGMILFSANNEKRCWVYSIRDLTSFDNIDIDSVI
jgi:hypothetical protein